MNYTIIIEGDPTFGTKYLCDAEILAENWDPDHRTCIVDNATGEVLREYPANRG